MSGNFVRGQTIFLLVGAAGIFWYLGAGTEVEDTVTQELEPDAYTRWDSLFAAAASHLGVPDYGPLQDASGNAVLSGGPGWWILKAICWQESDLGRYPSVVAGLADPNDREGSVSDDGLSWGLMQETLDTAADMRPGTTVADLNNPEIAVDIAARILVRNALHFPGNLEYQVRAYNGGLGFLKTARGISDTPIYWKSVLKKLRKIEANGG